MKIVMKKIMKKKSDKKGKKNKYLMKKIKPNNLNNLREKIKRRRVNRLYLMKYS